MTDDAVISEWIRSSIGLDPATLTETQRASLGAYVTGLINKWIESGGFDPTTLTEKQRACQVAAWLKLDQIAAIDNKIRLDKKRDIKRKLSRDIDRMVMDAAIYIKRDARAYGLIVAIHKIAIESHWDLEKTHGELLKVKADFDTRTFAGLMEWWGSAIREEIHTIRARELLTWFDWHATQARGRESDESLQDLRSALGTVEGKLSGVTFSSEGAIRKDRFSQEWMKEVHAAKRFETSYRAKWENWLRRERAIDGEKVKTRFAMLPPPQYFLDYANPDDLQGELFIDEVFLGGFNVHPLSALLYATREDM